jgi:hypothetical protein
MNLAGIVAVSGRPGLWKALSQNKTGFILESLDEQKTKLVANLSTAKLAALDEITIFGFDDDLKLTDVFENIKKTGNVPDAKADGKVLRAYFKTIAPDHDEEKVYASDMKKVITWYNILKDMPLFNEATPVAGEAGEEKSAAVKPVTIEKPKNVVQKKAAAAPKGPKVANAKNPRKAS